MRSEPLARRPTLAKLARTRFAEITNEKIHVFTVQIPRNSQSYRVYANVHVAVKRDIPSERLLKCRKHFSQSIMVWVAVSQLGKSSLVFVEAKVNSFYYCDVALHQGLLSDIIAHSGDDFTFQQDGAPAHRSRKTVAFLTAHFPKCIEPENWPPNSPDLNPVDYSIWGVLKQLVYRQRIRDIEHLKEVLTARWNEISQDTINRVIGQFSKLLSLVIAANGGRIHVLNITLTEISYALRKF